MFSFIPSRNPQADVAQTLEFPKTEGLDITYWTHTWFNSHCVRLQTMLFFNQSFKKTPIPFSQYVTHKQTSWGQKQSQKQKDPVPIILWLPLDFTVSHDLPGSRSLSSSLCPWLKLLCSPSQETIVTVLLTVQFRG